jgi:hypothetical protein
MIVREVKEINGKQFNYTYSDDGHVLRCGRLKYIDAADPIGVDKAYFEEGVVPIEAVEQDGESDGDN